MKTSSDNDLRARFQAQRQAEREQAPCWDGIALQSPGRARKPMLNLRLLALPACAAALLVLVTWLALPAPAPRLVEALPVLLDSPAAPLFAGLEADMTAPSDFLLPSYLQIELP